jgi:hypothetical protein
MLATFDRGLASLISKPFSEARYRNASLDIYMCEPNMQA